MGMERRAEGSRDRRQNQLRVKAHSMLESLEVATTATIQRTVKAPGWIPKPSLKRSVPVDIRAKGNKRTC